MHKVSSYQKMDVVDAVLRYFTGSHHRHHSATATTKTEITAATKAEIIKAFIRVGAACGILFFTVKYLVKYMDPTYFKKEGVKKQAKALLKELGISSSIELTEYEMQIASNLVNVDKLGVDWEDIGGCEELIAEMMDTVILPLKIGNFSPLLTPPKGVLLYGPPGCGKTLIAKAIAKAASARFFNLQVSGLTDMWYGESQKLSAAVFTLARKLQPTIIFIDEIDSFLRSRQAHDHEATAMMKAQFMSAWDGFASDNSCTVMILGATNRPLDVDKAILRRMPCRFCIASPNDGQRFSILKVILRGEKVSNKVDLYEVAQESSGLSGSDLLEVCRLAAVSRAKDLILRGIHLNSPEADARPITKENFALAVKNYRLSKKCLELSSVSSSEIKLD